MTNAALRKKQNNIKYQVCTAVALQIKHGPYTLKRLHTCSREQNVCYIRVYLEYLSLENMLYIRSDSNKPNLASKQTNLCKFEEIVSKCAAYKFSKALFLLMHFKILNVNTLNWHLVNCLKSAWHLLVSACPIPIIYLVSVNVFAETLENLHCKDGNIKNTTLERKVDK